MDQLFLDEQVLAYVKSLEPTLAQKQAAQRSQNAIRSALDSGNMARRIVGDYLSGSYARKTAIAPIDDVDIIFVIDPTKWREATPQKVLETFVGAIRLRRESSRVEMQRRSVGLKMNHLDIDAVPAVPTQREGYVQIPDRSTGSWILTAPKVHAAAATAVNQARGGLFIPLVKVLKGWNSNLPRTTAFKSFSIETMAVRIFQETALSSPFEGLLRYFDFLCSQFSEATMFRWTDNFGIGLARPCWSYQLPDIAETGSNLLANLSDERRERFLTAALRARDNLLKAQAARSEYTCAEHLAKVLR